MTDYNETVDPIVRYWEEIEYTTKPVDNLVHATEIYLKQSKIELEDDVLGIFDNPDRLDLLEWYKGIQL